MPLPTDSVAGAKAARRRRCLDRRRAFATARVQRASDAVTEAVQALPAFVAATAVHTYVGGRDAEIDTRGLILAALAAGKRVAVPVVKPDEVHMGHAFLKTLEDLKEGPWGLAQPIVEPSFDLPDDLGLVIVPGIAFDRRGHRIGYGRGYYDRLLAALNAATYTLGLTYGEFLFDALPVQAHDRPVDAVLTDQGLFTVRPFPLAPGAPA